MAGKNKKKKRSQAAEPKSPQSEYVPVVKATHSVRVRTPRNDLSSTRKERINFKAWFINLLSLDPRVKEHHYDQVKSYMYGLGLQDNEEVSQYEGALRGYFGG